MHSILEMQDYKENVFHSGVVSVLLSVYKPSHTQHTHSLPLEFRLTALSKWKNPKPRSLWPLDGSAGCFCCMNLPLMYRLFVVQLLDYSATGMTNISGHAIEKRGLWIEIVLLWKQNKVFYFLCCFISTFSEGMCSWVLTGKLTICFVLLTIGNTIVYTVLYCGSTWAATDDVKSLENAQNCTGRCLNF